MKFIIFTKTLWQEAPRLRHQIARMLAKHGHEVAFFEKNSRPGTRRSSEDAGISLLQHGELLHHQLRLLRPISRINAWYEKGQIKEMAAGWADATLINFNYDYFFLRELFPHNPIITFVNDDFVAEAPWIRRPEARRVLAATSRMSDYVFVPSYPLLKQVREFTTAADVFFPWARQAYTRPQNGSRDEMIYWGYINERIDEQAVRGVLDAGHVINFVGPVSGRPSLHELVRHRNARHHGEAQLEDIPDIMARCACSILPYDANPTTSRWAEMIAAITINNRAFQLLSFGLALLYADLPGLIAAPGDVIYKCKTADDYGRAFEGARDHFWEAQPSIERFLQGHSEEDRYEELMEQVQTTRQRRATHDAPATLVQSQI